MKPITKKQVLTKRFAYLIGAFLADGCFYLAEGKYPRFEFYDGTSVKSELKYSLAHIDKIRDIVSDYFKINSSIRQRGNRYILCFRSQKFAQILQKLFFVRPGKKARKIDLPLLYKGKNLEKFFWLGIMDCDGMIARNSKKIALEVSSKKLIKSFKEFLNKNSIKFFYAKRYNDKRKYYRIIIPSVYIKDYSKWLGFTHPRKKLWLKRHIAKGGFMKRNIVNFNKLYHRRTLDYSVFLDTNAYIEAGKHLIKKYSLDYDYPKENVKFRKAYQILRSCGLNKVQIFKELSNFRWKMGKGSKYSIRLPHRFDKRLLDIAKVIRIRNYGILIPRTYSRALNLNYKVIIKNINDIFETKPTMTMKKEPIYSSGILYLFFSNAIDYRGK